MEKGKNNNKVIIIILVILILVLLILGCILFINDNRTNKNKKESVLNSDNNYKISNKQEELDDTKVIENDNMKVPHCVDDICVSNVTMYYANKKGRVTYTITNNSNVEANGYLKMNFGSNSLIISYDNLKSGEMFETVSYFDDKSFENVSDYKLEKLDKKEKSKIVVIK